MVNLNPIGFPLPISHLELLDRYLELPIWALPAGIAREGRDELPFAIGKAEAFVVLLGND